MKEKTIYKNALKLLEELITGEEATPTVKPKYVSETIAMLALVLNYYEKERFMFGNPTPVEAIRFRMEQQGLKQKDLIPYIGSKSRVSEVLSGKRKLSLRMIRNLHTGLGVPLEPLVGN